MYVEQIVAKILIHPNMPMCVHTYLAELGPLCSDFMSDICVFVLAALHFCVCSVCRTKNSTYTVIQGG